MGTSDEEMITAGWVWKDGDWRRPGPEADLPTPERWLIGRMEVDGQHYKHAIFVSFATMEEFRAAVRQVDGWFNS